MKKFHIITISGMLGSGKSTVAKLLAQQLNYGYYSTGNAQREIAKQRGITTLELNQLAQTDPSIDAEIDGIFKNFGSVPSKSFILDSRLAFFFVPSSFKVKLNVDVQVAAERIFNDRLRTGEKSYQSINEAADFLLKRRSLEVDRFKRIYHVDIDNDENFDYVIDSTYLTPSEITEKIIRRFNLEKADNE